MSEEVFEELPSDPLQRAIEAFMDVCAAYGFSAEELGDENWQHLLNEGVLREGDGALMLTDQDKEPLSPQFRSELKDKLRELPIRPVKFDWLENEDGYVILVFSKNNA